MKTISVLLLGGEVSVRSVLSRLLEREADLDVWEAPREQAPDVILVTLTRPELARELRRSYPSSKLLARISVFQPELRQLPELDRALDDLAPYEVLLQAIRRSVQGAC